MRKLHSYASVAAALTSIALLSARADAQAVAQRVAQPAHPMASTERPGTQGKHNNAASSYTFIHMADTQFGFFSTPLLIAWLGRGWNSDAFSRETVLFERAVERARDYSPAFAVMCGDLINVAGHEGQAKEFLRIRDRLADEVPFYLMPGNHDVGNKPTPESLAWYRATFGKDWYSFRHQMTHAIVLNSSLVRTPDAVPDEAEAQMRWLRAELAIARDQPTDQLFVFMHYPLFLAEPDEPSSYFNIPIEQRAGLLALFERFEVTAVFAGHYHRNAEGHAGKMAMITTGAVGRPMGGAQSGIRVVEVSSDRIEHRYVVIEDPAP